MYLYFIFSGMFNRGTICTAEEEARSKMSQERVNEPVELSDFDRQVMNVYNTMHLR